MLGSSDKKIDSFALLKATVIGLTPSELTDYIQYSYFVDSILRFKEIYQRNAKFGEMLLEHKEVRALFKSRDDLQELLDKEEKQEVDEFSFFAPTSRNEALPIFLELLKYDEPVQLVNKDFILDNAGALVQSRADFMKITEKNIGVARALIQSEEVLKWLSLDDIYGLLSSHSSQLSSLAMLLIQSPKIEFFNWNKAQFLKFAALVPQIGYMLLEHPSIKESVGDAKAQIGWAALQKHYPVSERDKKNIDALDIATPLAPKKSPDKNLKVEQEKILQLTMEKLKTRLMPVHDYFDQMMFGGESGYYSHGRVDFEKDFVTFASNPKSARALAGGFAYQMLMCRKKMIAEGNLEEKDFFNVLEGGAGNGNLCFNILSVIKAMAESTDPKVDPEWKSLERTIRYHIIERSPELVKTQRHLNQQFISTKQLEITQADAKDFGDVLSPTKMAMVISNELLDVFPPHQLVMNEKGELAVTMLAPTIHAQVLNEKFKDLFPTEAKFEEYFEKLEKKSAENVALLKVQLGDLEPGPDLYLTKADFLLLHKMAVQKPELIDAFSFHSVSMDSRYFPKIADFIKHNKEFFAMMRPGDVQLLSLAMDDFIKNVANILIENGEIISVDYGNNAILADKRLRTYSKGKTDFKFLDKPGFKDITYDINFSDMINRSKKFGVEPLYFGNQAQLLPAQCYFPENVVSKESREYLATHPQGKNFQVCVQVKAGPVADLVSDLKIEKTRFEKVSELVTYSALFENFKNNLVAIKQQFNNEISLLTHITDFKFEQKGRDMLVTHSNTQNVEDLHLLFIKHKIPVRVMDDTLIVALVELPHIKKLNATQKNYQR